MIFQVVSVTARSFNKKIIYTAKLKPVGPSICPKSKIYLETYDKPFYQPGDYYKLDLEFLNNYTPPNLTTY